MNTPEFIVLHTTDSRGGTRDLIDSDHRHQRGFAAIGYHWVIRNGRSAWGGGRYVADIDGYVEPGRPEELVGAHAPGMNGRSVGVALVASRDMPVTERQRASLLTLVRDVMRRYGIPPERVIGHREVPDCPPAKAHCPLLDMDEFRALLRG